MVRSKSSPSKNVDYQMSYFESEIQALSHPTEITGFYEIEVPYPFNPGNLYDDGYQSNALPYGFPFQFFFREMFTIKHDIVKPDGTIIKNQEVYGCDNKLCNISLTEAVNMKDCVASII